MSNCLEIKKNTVYRIFEKVDASTPAGLKDIGRYKMVGDTIEPAKCLWVGGVATGHYDTGLDESSVDFNGLAASDVKKVLQDRKELAAYYGKQLEVYLKKYPKNTEQDFLASHYCGIELSHGKIIDTSSLDNYLKLYLAFRGGQITPSCDIKNPNYNPSLYVIKQVSDKNEVTESGFEKRAKVLGWYSNKKDNHFDEIVKILQFAGAVSYGRRATHTVIEGLLENYIKDTDNLDNLIKVIDTVPLEEVYIKHKIQSLISKRVIVKEDNQYVYKGEQLGRSVADVYNNLLKETHSALLDSIQLEK